MIRFGKKDYCDVVLVHSFCIRFVSVLKSNDAYLQHFFHVSCGFKLGDFSFKQITSGNCCACNLGVLGFSVMQLNARIEHFFQV